MPYFSTFATIKRQVMADRKIIHLQKEGQDYYFGSVSAIFTIFTKDDIGISYGSLRNYAISPDKPYINKLVTIKEGSLISAKGNRGIKAKEKEQG